MMHKTSVNIPEASRKALIEMLNQKLADITVLTAQLKQAHWNVKGLHFMPAHELFDKVYENLHPFIDDVAERVVQLGGIAEGTVRSAAANSKVPAFPKGSYTFEEILPKVIEHYAFVINGIRTAIDVADEHDDDATEDQLIEILRVMDKDLWFLEAHSQ